MLAERQREREERTRVPRRVRRSPPPRPCRAAQGQARAAPHRQDTRRARPRGSCPRGFGTDGRASSSPRRLGHRCSARCSASGGGCRPARWSGRRRCAGVACGPACGGCGGEAAGVASASARNLPGGSSVLLRKHGLGRRSAGKQHRGLWRSLRRMRRLDVFGVRLDLGRRVPGETAPRAACWRSLRRMCGWTLRVRLDLGRRVPGVQHRGLWRSLRRMCGWTLRGPSRPGAEGAGETAPRAVAEPEPDVRLDASGPSPTIGSAARQQWGWWLPVGAGSGAAIQGGIRVERLRGRGRRGRVLRCGGVVVV